MKKQKVQAQISITESQAACKTILSSDKFVHAPRMCRLLQFLVDSAISGNTRNTSEYAIGIAVFDRNASTYSTTEDPAVRVQVGRLREKLKDYYSSVASEIEISIPLGSYMPIFRRSSDANEGANGLLIFRQITCISECPKGRPFAQGLHEELLHQLYKAFNRITIVQQLPSGADDNNGNESKKDFNRGAKNLLEGYIRIDSQRIRTSLRLLDLEHNQIRWSKQFDRNTCYDITLQEELAFSICQELKQFMLKNELDIFDSELPISEKLHGENRITPIGQERRPAIPIDTKSTRKARIMELTGGRACATEVDSTQVLKS